MATTGYPGKVDEDHPELFDIRVMPAQPEDLKPGQLPPETIKQFFEDVSIYKQSWFLTTSYP